jgi:hypothetical protein
MEDLHRRKKRGGKKDGRIGIGIGIGKERH